jgi:glycine betaine/proline transport system substrate-binding protein
MRRRYLRTSVLFAAVSLVLAGCGGAKVGEDSSSGGGGGDSADCGDFNIAVNPWVGYEADAAVVGYVAEKELGCNVTKKDLKEEVAWQGFGTARSTWCWRTGATTT